MNPTSTSLRNVVAAGVIAVAASLALGACGSASAPVVASTPSVSESSAPASSPQGTAQQTGQSTQPQTTDSQTTGQQTTGAPAGTARTHVVQSGDQKVVLPEGVTLPPGAEISVATLGQVILAAPGREAVLKHYRQELSTGGFTITADLGTHLQWEGNGWAGSISAGETSSVLAYWELGSEDGQETQTTSQDSDDVAVVPAELGITGAPFNFRLPAGTTIIQLNNTDTGSHFTITAPEPARVHQFLKQNVLSTVFFTVDSDGVVNGRGELRFHDDEYNALLTFEGDKVIVVFTAR